MRSTGKKFLYAICTVYMIISLSFLLIHIMPGKPIMYLVGQEEYYYLLDQYPAELEALKLKFGLDDSLWVQYKKYLKCIATLDFGRAYSNHQPVSQNVLRAAKSTLLLSIPTWILGGILGAVLGTLAGWRTKGIFDRITTPFFLFVNTIPSNCIGLIFLIIFSYKLKIFPINGMVGPGLSGRVRFWSLLNHMALPLIILVLSRTAGNFMLMKSSVSQICNEDYLITAESKGLEDKKVLFRHVLCNALLPYSTSLSIQLGWLLSGAMIVEVIFGWKGMGSLMFDAVSRRDFPTAQLCFLISAVSVVAANWISDIVNIIIDPRVRDEQ